MDKVVVALCEQGPALETSRHAMEAMAKKAEDLMMQGRQREALEILQNVGQAAQNEYAGATGRPRKLMPTSKTTIDFYYSADR
jgi:hypothetical protein